MILGSGAAGKAATSRRTLKGARRKLGSRPARLLLSRVLEKAGELVLGYTIHLVAKVAGQLGALVLLEHVLDLAPAQCRDDQKRPILGALAMETRLDFFGQRQAYVAEGAVKHFDWLQAVTHHLS